MEDERGVLGRGGFTIELRNLQFQGPSPVCIPSRGPLNDKSFRSHKNASALVLIQFRVGKVEAKTHGLPVYGVWAWHSCV